MKKRLITIEWSGILTVAFEIPNTKCDVNHCKQNPFRVFNEKNLVKRALRTCKMVIVELFHANEKYPTQGNGFSHQKYYNHGHII